MTSMLLNLEIDAKLNDYSVTLAYQWFYQNEFPQDMESGETPRKHLQSFLLSLSRAVFFMVSNKRFVKRKRPVESI